MRYKISKKREYKPHFEALIDARILRDFSTESPIGIRSARLKSSLLLSAFAYEGYLNYLGRKLFPSWKDFERSLSWHSKTKLIADRIGFSFNEGQPPFQTIKKLFTFRDDMAHPKPDELADKYEIEKSYPVHLDVNFYMPLTTDSEKFCTEKNANRCIEHVEQMIMLLHEQAKADKNHPLLPGEEWGSAEVL